MSLFQKHQETLNKAIKALHERTFFAQYPEHPSPKIYGEEADADGRKKFQKQLKSDFTELNSKGSNSSVGSEISPYLNMELGINYPFFEPETLIEKGKNVFELWRRTSPGDRAGILIESLERFKKRFFEVAYATMHTTGQGYMMAFQASGPHAADRALEAIAAGYEELNRFPKEAVWDKPMGKYNIKLKKSWTAVPKGLGLVIGCSTFPTWNSVPGIYASLITGNPVIIKPHPMSILPIAILSAEIQNVLAENGLPKEICQFAPDSPENLISKKLAEDGNVKLIDYTGGSEFGNYLESLEGKVTFTEKTGINSIILDSVEDLDKVLQNIAFSITLYSGQMCTAPQNIFIPESGVKTKEGHVSFDDVANKLSEAVNSLVNNPKAGPFVLGAIQNPATIERMKNLNFGNNILAENKIENPMFKEARVMTPKLSVVDKKDREHFKKEIFGPYAMLIKTSNTEESIELASSLAKEYGAISCGAYSIDNDVQEKIKSAMELSYTSVSFNLTGGIYVNQNAAFSDFHVTGGNPAGNASFTNPEYVIKRFVWVGTRIPI
ncbi:phenylacetic acid degradation protein PaaN [Hyphobacterium sp. CCMP332]|nr:phenylacetic acid degradation protein PaaN [Hyphobacterium sp. CCMP332]